MKHRLLLVLVLVFSSSAAVAGVQFQQFQAKRACFAQVNGYYIPKLDYIKRAAHGSKWDINAMVKYNNTQNLFKINLLRCEHMPDGSNNSAM